MTYKPDKIVISEKSEDLYYDVASAICSYANECVNKNGVFNIALAGGSTPKKLYATLASSPWIDKMPWQSCHFYFGDERMVAHDHADSNYLMVKQALFDHAPIPDENIHPVPTDCKDPDICAKQYAITILQAGSFDLVLLGIGNDGHTASLFPETEILQEQNKKAAAVFVKKMDSWRISLTYPVLNNAQRVLVLIQGESKRTIVNKVLHGDNPSQYPITAVRPTGELVWHLDRDAFPDTKK